MEDKVLSIMQNIFEDDTIGKDCSQSECESWDSLHHLSLISELEDEFDIEFEPEEINIMTDFSTICSIIVDKTT